MSTVHTAAASVPPAFPVPPPASANFSAAARTDYDPKLLGAMNIPARLRWAYEKFGPHLVLTSSFGPQSVILFELLYKQERLNVPVVTVDIAQPEYDEQRAYRNTLMREYGLREGREIHIFPARDDKEKALAMNEGIRRIGAVAWLDGRRREQKVVGDDRASLDFIDITSRGFVKICPILDLSDADKDWFIQSLPPEVRHPRYAPGVVATGGAIVPVKTACNLHVGRSAPPPEGYDWVI